MYKKEIMAIKEAGMLADYHGLPFVVVDEGSNNFVCRSLDAISTLDNVCAVILSDGSFQRLGSYVVRNVNEN